MPRPLILAAALLFGTPLLAHDYTLGDLQIIHPHILQPAKTALTAGGYLTIVNTGTEAQVLTGVESDIAKKVALHHTMVDANGTARMDHVAEILIPAGETVALERGGHHVMFMGLTEPLTEGQMVKATLIFGDARVAVEFAVDPTDGQGHDHMSH